MAALTNRLYNPSPHKISHLNYAALPALRPFMRKTSESLHISLKSPFKMDSFRESTAEESPRPGKTDLVSAK